MQRSKAPEGKGCGTKQPYDDRPAIERCPKLYSAVPCAIIESSVGSEIAAYVCSISYRGGQGRPTSIVLLAGITSCGRDSDQAIPGMNLFAQIALNEGHPT